MEQTAAETFKKRCRMLWWSQSAHCVPVQGGCSRLQQLHPMVCMRLMKTIGSAAGAVLAALLLSLQMHSLGMHFHNLASSEIKCTLKQGNLVYETLYHSTF